jgi:hypothetical protein
METNDERRKRRLAQICEGHGGVRAVAERAGLAWETLDQILKGTLLPQKADGTRSARSLGDPAARKIEEVFHLGRGWFDWPFDMVDFNAFAALDAEERGAVQAAMNAEIRRIAEVKAKQVLRKMGARKEAISDAGVEARMPVTKPTKRKSNFNFDNPQQEDNDGNHDVHGIQGQENAGSAGRGGRTGAKR